MNWKKKQHKNDNKTTMRNQNQAKFTEKEIKYFRCWLIEIHKMLLLCLCRLMDIAVATKCIFKALLFSLCVLVCVCVCRIFRMHWSRCVGHVDAKNNEFTRVSESEFIWFNKINTVRSTFHKFKGSIEKTKKNSLSCYPEYRTEDKIGNDFRVHCMKQWITNTHTNTLHHRQTMMALCASIVLPNKS